MARTRLSDTTIKALFAKSGNRCAFPSCAQQLISDRNDAIGHICHIEAASPGGPRFNAQSNEEQRASYENLLLMCYAHHVEIDQHTEDYPVEKLRQLKNEHERVFARNEIEVNQRIITQARQSERYWMDLETRSRELQKQLELHVEVDSSLDIDRLIEELQKQHAWLRTYVGRVQQSDESLMSDLELICKRFGWDFSQIEKMHYTENAFVSRNWELHNLGGNNVFIKTELIVLQLKIRILEIKLRIDPANQAYKSRIEELQDQLKTFVETAIFSD